jgi:2-succinyl-5-enolpyruvyl-6-hydroxy-3-cyclohexene-1-carboxylate synthase
LASVERLVVVDRHHLDPDPERRATWRLHADPHDLASAVIADAPRPAAAGWLEAWRAVDDIARSALDAVLDSWDEPFEGRVARDLAGAIPDGARLVVGSSMPIRDLDAFMTPREGLRVLANRGASGIDGLVSTTLGVAASGSSTYALLGDLSLLHDAGSLLWSASRGYDAVLVVPNNGGGGVFSFLPQASLPEFERLFATPHGLDLAAVASAARAGYERVERATDLVPAIERAAAAGGVQVIEAPSDREANVARHAEVAHVVREALASTT